MEQNGNPVHRPNDFRKLVAWLGLSPSHADDAIQNGYLRCWEKVGSLDLSPEALPLLKRFVIYEALNLRRHVNGRNEVLTSFDELDLGDGRPGPEDHAAARELYAKLLTSIDQLNNTLKAVLVAHVLNGVSLADIAEARGITEKTAENQLAAARVALKELMKPWQSEPVRSGRRTARGLLFPLWQLDLRAWFKERLEATAHAMGSAVRGGLLGGLLISGHACTTEPSPLRSALHLSPMAFAVVTNALLETRQLEIHSTNETVESSRATLPARSLAKAPPKEADATTPDLETSLILRARSLIETGSAEAIIQASELLNEHSDKYRDGRLAKQRETLRQRIRGAPYVRTTTEIADSDAMAKMLGNGLP